MKQDELDVGIELTTCFDVVNKLAHASGHRGTHGAPAASPVVAENAARTGLFAARKTKVLLNASLTVTSPYLELARDLHAMRTASMALTPAAGASAVLPTMGFVVSTVSYQYQFCLC